MQNFDFCIVNSLTKVLPNERPENGQKNLILDAFCGERVSFQLVYCLNQSNSSINSKQFKTVINNCPLPYQIRKVELIPCRYSCPYNHDENYLITNSQLMPDPLFACDGIIRPVYHLYQSLWIDIDICDTTYEKIDIEIKIIPFNTSQSIEDLNMHEKNEYNWKGTIELNICKKKLPSLDLKHTEWLYCDCLAHYYNVPVFSDKHWEIIKNYLFFAAKESAVNVILTPVFTPPLNTAVGKERTTVQLVKITKEKNEYFFDFTLLQRWCDLCGAAGIENLEIPHFFSQWGAKAAPKIIVTEQTSEKVMFGWHTNATSLEYIRFLKCFIPALLNFFKENKYTADNLYFHISDEPNERYFSSYTAAKETIKDLLYGYTIIDCLSDLQFYKKGIVEHPIPSISFVKPFIEENIKSLWIYYACPDGNKVPNRFLAMPGERTRILGVLMYLYRIKGFLHWGYNYYNDMLSEKAIDPYITTDCDYSLPAGDAFLVYPASAGTVNSSIRNELQMQGFYDYRALKLLENYTSYDHVVSIIHKNLDYMITFEHYPLDVHFFIELKKNIIMRIKELKVV